MPDRTVRVPAFNSDPLDDLKRWIKMVYHQARRKINWKQAEKFKEVLPIETASYAERMTFGLWRLLAPACVLRPASGVQTQDAQLTTQDAKSPLQQALEALRPSINPVLWDRFRVEFVRFLKLAFLAIHNADYDPAMVAAMNEWFQAWLAGTRGAPRAGRGMARDEGRPCDYIRSGFPRPRLEFVLCPETVEDYNSERFFTIRSAIWERFTGQPLDRSQYLTPSGLKQMEMDLVISRPVNRSASQPGDR